MNRYQVTYFIGDVEKQVIIEASYTGEVFVKLEEIEPDAHNIRIEKIND